MSKGNFIGDLGRILVNSGQVFLGGMVVGGAMGKTNDGTFSLIMLGVLFAFLSFAIGLLCLEISRQI